MSLPEVIENFSYLTDWEDKYRYLIELGDALEPFDGADKIAENKVDGCMSQVWFTWTKTGNVYHFKADSDAHIVRGLESVLLQLVNDKTAADILAVDVPGYFQQMGLEAHLSPTRRNGFFSMINRIHQIVQTNG